MRLGLDVAGEGMAVDEMFPAENNGMLRHAFESLEGSNILWHIVAPPPRPIFVCLSYYFAPDLVWLHV